MAAPRKLSWDVHAVLMARVAEPENEQACWLVDFSLNKPSGYPQVTVPVAFRRRPSERKRYAHVLSYELFVDVVPDGHEVDHVCEVHECINPNHLRAIPVADNRRGGARKTNEARCGSA